MLRLDLLLVRWAIQLRSKLEGNHWFHIPLQGAVAAISVYWFWHIPAPNKAVLVLGGVAAIMALVEMRPLHKAIYFALIIALMFAENRAIDNDRREFANQEAQRRTVENQQFSRIGQSITTNVQKLLDNSDKEFSETTRQQRQHFDATMRQFHINVNEITGGNSFAVISPILLDIGTPNTFPLMLAVRGKYDLMDAMVEIRRLPIQNEGSLSGLSDYINGVNFGHETIGTISHTSGRLLSYKLSGLRKEEINEWSINVYARNRPIHEDLKVRWNAALSHWESSFVVMEERKAKNGSSYEFVLEESKPEWYGSSLLPPVSPPLKRPRKKKK